GVFVPERDDDRAGQRGKIDHAFRLEAAGVPDDVGEHEPPLGVGVDDLDGLPRHGLDDVTGTLRVAVRHVLDEADDADGIDLGLAAGQRAHQAGDAGRPRHVALHVLHAAGGLDGDAAG